MAEHNKKHGTLGGRTKVRRWYEENRGQYDRLLSAAESTVRAVLSHERIKPMTVMGRLKDLTSLEEKVRRKRYKNLASELMDFAALRIVAYRLSDVSRISDALRKYLVVHESHSEDKGKRLEPNRLGYHSVHLICELGPQRCELPEFVQFKGLLFEVQVRTVLQHAWAELEHTLYKGAAALPPEVTRQLYLQAGGLESIDKNLDDVASNIARYRASVSQEVNRGSYDRPLNGTAVAALLKKKFPDLDQSRTDTDTLTQVIEELTVFGITTVELLGKLLDGARVDDAALEDNSVAGVLRDAMMYTDLDRYLKNCWKGRWHMPCEEGEYSDEAMQLIERLAPKYDEDRVVEALNDAGVLLEADADEHLPDWETQEGVYNGEYDAHVEQFDDQEPPSGPHGED